MKKTIGAVMALLGSLILPHTWAAGPAVRVEDATVTPRQLEADGLRQDALRQGTTSFSGKIAPEQDARGGCDGVKNGQWGFHTDNEPHPWWQVDLGRSTALDRVVLYNRCDAMAGRNARIMILVSEDARSFRQVYQHNGTIFYGFTDKKPLSVSLKAVKARYLRLQLPGTDYFHLDEVEVYPVGASRNVALGRPATQSSTSQWSVNHTEQIARGGKAEKSGTATALRRGLLLAANLAKQGVKVAEEVRKLQDCQGRLKALPADVPEETLRQLSAEVRGTVRRLALRNPILDFDSILFVKGAPTRFPHMSDQFYGWWSRPGGGVYLLEGFKGDSPRLRCLTADMAEGSFIRPDLSYDGRKILFAYCKSYKHVPEVQNKAIKVTLPEDAFYHVFEMNLDGSGRRQLTHGRYDDFDARYLPSGDIVFLSTRKGRFVQVTRENTEATASADLPDSYVRCGGDNYRPVPVFTLHVMNGQGGELRPASAFENFEYTPSVSNDGRILYARWDYIDRFNGHFFSLWSTNPDGTNAQLVYKNYTVRPQTATEARALPNSHKIVFTASAHHSILGGSLVLLDRTKGTEGAEPIVRLTPEVPFPEAEANIGCYYAGPYPLSEEHYLVGWADRPLPPHSRVDSTLQNPVNAMGLYLYDVFGNLTLLHRDPDISSSNPIPVRPRPRPPVQPERVAWNGSQEGAFLLQDVYQGLTGVPRGTVKSLRVVGVPPKVQPHMNNPNLGVSAEDPGKYLLGSVPVEEDGSAYFRVPSGVSVFFQALDADGLALQTMRSLTYVGPQQTMSCIGCHETREAAPVLGGRSPTALRREPSKLRAGPSGSWPLRYDQLVQPVLDKSCISCHRPGSGNAQAAHLDLTSPKSYDSLLSFGGKNLQQLAFERDRSIVGDCPARKSKLLALLRSDKGHQGVRLDADSLNRLITWMDLYAQCAGALQRSAGRRIEAIPDQNGAPFDTVTRRQERQPADLVPLALPVRLQTYTFARFRTQSTHRERGVGCPSPSWGSTQREATKFDFHHSHRGTIMAEASHDRELKNALAQIEKQFGKGAIMQLGEGSVADVPGISSGALSLDLALGGRGLPRGRIIEIFGPESGGKTTLALHAVANAQKQGGVAAFIDVEHALDPSWAKRVGVNLEELLVSQPPNGEEALKIAEMLIKSNAVDIIVLDSVAALVPKAEVEGEIGDSHVGIQARLMSQALRILNPTISKTKTCMIFINQIRQKIGVMFGNPETTSGGLALKFYSSIRLEIRKVTTVKEGDETVGSRVRVKVVKNKIAPPFKQAEFDLMHDSGISREGDLIDLGIEDRIIEKSGAWISYGDTRLGQGKENAKQYLRDNPALLEEIEKKILEKRGLVGLPTGEPEENGKAEDPPRPETPASNRISRKQAAQAE